MYRLTLLFAVCLCCLFLLAPVQAQDKEENTPSLQEAETRDDVYGYLIRETEKIRSRTQDSKENARATAAIFFAAGDRLLEIAKDDWAIKDAYHTKIQGFLALMAAGEDAEQKLEKLLDELDKKG